MQLNLKFNLKYCIKSKLNSKNAFVFLQLLGRFKHAQKIFNIELNLNVFKIGENWRNLWSNLLEFLKCVAILKIFSKILMKSWRKFKTFNQNMQKIFCIQVYFYLFNRFSFFIYFRHLLVDPTPQHSFMRFGLIQNKIVVCDLKIGSKLL